MTLAGPSGMVVACSAIAGMALALAGIAVVILERPEGAAPAAASFEGNAVDRALETIRRHLSAGVLAGLGAALGSAAGALIAKPALGHLETTAATWVRMCGGAAGLLVGGLLTGRLGAWGRGIAHRETFDLAHLDLAMPGLLEKAGHVSRERMTDRSLFSRERLGQR